MFNRKSVKTSFAALALGAALLGASAPQASAGGGGGGWKHHNHHGHGWGAAGLGLGLGLAYALSGPRYGYVEECYTVYKKRFVPGVGKVLRPVTICD